MHYNRRTSALLAAGVVSLAAVAHAEEKITPALQTALTSTTISGYVNTSAIWKFGTGNANLPGRSFDGPAKQDGFNLDVVNLVVEKPLGEEEWSAGYKVDLLFGPDANTLGTLSSTALAGGGAAADFGIKQAYVALHTPVGNGLDFKVGVWDAIIGYEVFNAGDNPNYSRSYGYFIEPTVHTGVLANYKVNDWLSVAGGVADGPATAPANAINRRSATESEKTYMGSFTLTAPESYGFLKGATLSGVIIDHASTGGAANDANIVNYYIGGTMPTPLSALTLGACYNYQGRSEVTGGAAGFYANAVTLYALYQATEKLKLNARAEYASGTAGVYGTAKGTPGTGDHNEEFLGLTLTADYSLWQNVISRAEVRWDHDLSGGPKAFGGAAAVGGTARNAVSLALNIIYKF